MARFTNVSPIQLTSPIAARHAHQGSLIDGGANVGMSGSDVRVLEQTLSHADVSGLDEQTVTDLPIVTAAGVLQSSQGYIIGIFHQYAHLGTGKTLHLSNPMRHFGLDICDIPHNLRGLQRIHHSDGYVIPLSIQNGLPYMYMHPPTNLEPETYPHVFFTSDITWDPRNLDQEYPVEDLYIDTDDCIPSFGHGEVNIYREFHTHESRLTPNQPDSRNT
jgi:hypothetical protein